MELMAAGFAQGSGGGGGVRAGVVVVVAGGVTVGGELEDEEVREVHHRHGQPRVERNVLELGGLQLGLHPRPPRHVTPRHAWCRAAAQQRHGHVKKNILVSGGG